MPIRGGVWGGYIGRTAYPPPHKVKKIYQRKSIRKVSSQCVWLLYAHSVTRVGLELTANGLKDHCPL